MFQRIARRHADRSDEPVASETADEQATNVAASAVDAQAPDGDSAPTAPGTEPTPVVDAPTERIELVAPAPAIDQPTVFQPAVTPAEQPTTVQPAASVPPPAAAAAPTPAPVPAATAAAAAAAVPAAATEATTPAEPAARRPGFRARGRMRRRLRYLRRLRDLQVRDLGGLAFDLRRFERKRDDLIAQKIDQIRACDDELRALEQALDERRDLRDVREPGIGGTCPRCFAIFGSADHFCSNCGAALGGAVQGPAQVPLTPSPSVATPPPATPPEASGSGPQP